MRYKPSVSVAHLSAPDIQDFIRSHEGGDVGALALKPMPEGCSRALILDQIKARTKARHKLPTWHAAAGVIFPSADLIEQCSSEATARYKAALTGGERFADLTAGAGIDSWVFAPRFAEGFCVERDDSAAALLRHNFKAMGVVAIQVVNDSAESFIETMPCVDFAYIDPQRRDGAQRGKFKLESCEPDIVALLPRLLDKAKTVMLKASPVLDIDEAVRVLGCVQAVHVVEMQGECREVLYLCGKNVSQDLPITAVSIDGAGRVLKHLTFTRAAEAAADVPLSAPLAYLYEPSAAFMKAGCFKVLAMRYGLKKLHPHTHLYTSESLVPDFCGRSFTIEAVLPADRKAVKAVLPTMKANLALRNFPSTVDDLKKRLGVKDGGDDYAFACTVMDGSRALVMTRRCP